MLAVETTTMHQGDEEGSDNVVRFVGPALEQRGSRSETAPRSPACQSIASSPAQGLLTPILITGSPGCAPKCTAPVLAIGIIDKGRTFSGLRVSSEVSHSYAEI